MRNIETDRLMLRPFEASDRDIIYRISSDPSVTRYLCHFGNEGSTPVQDTDRFVAYFLSAHAQTPQRAVEYAVVEKATGAVMGDCSIEYTQDAHTGEIGWILLPEYQHKGYATELGHALVRFGFEELLMDKIIAHCDARNTPSQGVMKRIGMKEEAIARGARPKKALDDAPGDELTYAIYKKEM